jgi:hypothetical protein
VQYVGECLTALSYHWKHAKELPAKFMDNVNEELAEKNEPNLARSLYHLAATGDCPPTLKEWLVDILAERVSSMGSMDGLFTDECRAIKDGTIPLCTATQKCSNSHTNLSYQLSTAVPPS